MGERYLDEERMRIISQALWDMNISPEEFLGIIESRIVRKWPSRGFCVARLLESVNWFDIAKVIQPKDICGLWEEAKKYVRDSSIKVGMDFACRILR